jgi:outer membrane protein assembly factor BamE (lipoprotein component of BamABCDE complex)
MRRSFYKKLVVALLFLLWIGWAGFLYASPKEWKEISLVFIVLTAVFAFRGWAADRAAHREGGYPKEDGSWPEDTAPAGKEPTQPPQRNAGSRPSSGDSSASDTPSSLGPRGWPQSFGETMNAKRVGLTICVVAVATVAGYLSVGLERYCVLYPGIDTCYAPAFSERKFAQVLIGMSKEEVIRLLGEPYHKSVGRDSVRWFYTQDGKCFWADWAWLGREIVFKEERVAERISRIYHD